MWNLFSGLSGLICAYFGEKRISLCFFMVMSGNNSNFTPQNN